MTVPTFPRHCSELLTLAGLLLVLTTTLVTGLTYELCGNNTLCGYGARCDNVTSQCVCLSGNGSLKKKNSNPFSLLYCLGEGVAQCGEELCGYRAQCNTGARHCGCSFSNGRLTQIEDTSPSLWYCVESCCPSSCSCPDNTTCADPSSVKKYHCYCSAGAKLSFTGQCLGNATTLHDTTESTSPTQGNATTVHDTTESTSPTQAKSQTLIIGLSAGIGGGAVLLAVIVLIVVVLVRRRKTKRGADTGTDNLRRQPQPPHHSSVHNSKAYESVVDPVPGPSGTDISACPTVIVRTEVSVMSPTSRPGAYEDVDKDFDVPYRASKVTAQVNKREADTRDDLYPNHTLPTNKDQQANNLISPTFPPRNKAKLTNAIELYSNHTIPFNKVQQGKKNNQELSESVPNKYNTLYDLTPANSNDGSLQPPKTASGIADHGTADYSVTYSIVGATGSNTQPASTVPRRDLEYYELKLPKV